VGGGKGSEKDSERKEMGNGNKSKRGKGNTADVFTQSISTCVVGRSGEVGRWEAELIGGSGKKRRNRQAGGKGWVSPASPIL
jgi:hypothetical protein